ncbi:MAG: GtrA family protein [Clostridia bacterium]|nr:GtrA family protein [Clostridia bacterium]
MNRLWEKIKTSPRLRELLLYLIFGVLTTAVNWVVYLIVTNALGLSAMEPLSAPYNAAVNLANVLGWVLSVLFAFLTNRKWVFTADRQGEKGFFRELWLFVSSRLLGFLLFDILLTNVLLVLLPDFQWILARDQWIKLFVNLLVIVYNYLASRFVVFRKKS